MFILAIAAAVALSAASAPAPPVPTIPPATIDNNLEINGESVAARQRRSRMFVGVMVNDAGPFQFLVDSGADRSVIGKALAKQIALPAGDTVRLHGMAGSAMVETVLLDRLRIGRSEITGIVAPSLSEQFLGAQGLLGIDALADQRLRLDFDALTVTIEDTRRPEVTHADEIVVTARRRKGQLILTEASVGIGRIYAVIDTGSEITMGNSALAARVFGRRGAPAAQSITLISVTGQELTARLATIPEVKVGSITLRDVPVAFADAPPFALFGLDTAPAMLLGTDVLQVFRRVSLDFRARRVRFALRR